MNEEDACNNELESVALVCAGGGAPRKLAYHCLVFLLVCSQRMVVGLTRKQQSVRSSRQSHRTAFAVSQCLVREYRHGPPHARPHTWFPSSSPSRRNRCHSKSHCSLHALATAMARTVHCSRNTDVTAGHIACTRTETLRGPMPVSCTTRSLPVPSIVSLLCPPPSPQLSTDSHIPSSADDGGCYSSPRRIPRPPRRPHRLERKFARYYRLRTSRIPRFPCDTPRYARPHPIRTHGSAAGLRWQVGEEREQSCVGIARGRCDGHSPVQGKGRWRQGYDGVWRAGGGGHIEEEAAGG
jgi:hypothetical protein